jgi:chromosome partitioning protein
MTHRRPTIVSIVNHKGGCLKTTLTANLGAALAAAGKRVLLVDLDAQQNLTQSLIGPIEVIEGVPTLYDAVVDETPLDVLITRTAVERLDIVPCAEDFAGADLSLVSAVGREHILRNCLERTAALADYDIVLLDNPPSISLVVVNALAASNWFLVPCSSEYLPMVGLTLLGNSIGRVQKVAPDLRLLGVVLTLFAKSERICNQVASLLRRDLGGKLFDTRIRVNTKAKSAPSVRKTIFEYESDKQGRGTLDFTALADEFLLRLKSLGETPSEGLVANG